MNHEEYKEAASLGALGALGRDEASALDEHTRACRECLRERAEMGAVASMLALAAEPIAPPEALRARLLERVREMRSEGRASESNETARVLRPPAEIFQRQRPSIFTSAVAYGALAASVLLAVSLFSMWRENRALRSQVAQLGAERNDIRGELAARRQELTRERELAELLSAPDTTRAPLAGTKDAPGARASLAYDSTSGRAVLIASGLPPAPEGKAYQVWYIAGGKPPVPGRTFKSDAAGHATLRDEIPQAGRNAKQVAVTLEPEGGVPAPTGSMYLVGTILNSLPSDAGMK